MNRDDKAKRGISSSNSTDFSANENADVRKSLNNNGSTKFCKIVGNLRKIARKIFTSTGVMATDDII